MHILATIVRVFGDPITLLLFASLIFEVFLVKSQTCGFGAQGWGFGGLETEGGGESRRLRSMHGTFIITNQRTGYADKEAAWVVLLSASFFNVLFGDPCTVLMLLSFKSEIWVVDTIDGGSGGDGRIRTRHRAGSWTWRITRVKRDSWLRTGIRGYSWGRSCGSFTVTFGGGNGGSDGSKQS